MKIATILVLAVCFLHGMSVVNALVRGENEPDKTSDRRRQLGKGKSKGGGCGGEGEMCCKDLRCDPGFCCDFETTCVECGGLGQRCCYDVDGDFRFCGGSKGSKSGKRRGLSKSKGTIALVCDNEVGAQCASVNICIPQDL